jgi:hypothetical protein
MLSRRFGAVAFGACAVVAIAAGAACSQSYAAEDAKADAAPEASATDDASLEAAVDADVTDNVVPPVSTFTVLASGLGPLGGIAATDTTVYFTVTSSVSSVPIGGGGVVPVGSVPGSPTNGSAGPITLTGSDLFWADVDARTLTHLPLGLGGVTTTHSMSPGSSPVALAASADTLVVLALSPPNGALDQFSFTLSSGMSVGALAPPYDVAVAGTAVYWTEPSVGQIGQGTTGTSNKSVLADNETGCESIAANAAGVYWTRPNDGLVRTSVASGAIGAATVAEKEISPSSIAVDDADVYWLTGDGTLRRKTIGQELPPATLAKGFKSAFAGTHVRAIALTAKYVVWLTTDGRVLRTDK